MHECQFEEVEISEDMKIEFFDDCIEEIGTLENVLFAFEQNPDDKQSIDGVFRIAHSLNGSSGFFKLEALRELAHGLENVLGALRSDSLIQSKF